MDYDGSSYPKAAPQQSDPLGAISKVQQIEQQGLAIDREKIAKYNEQYNLVNRGLGNLINVPKGELTPDHLQDFYQSLVKMGVPADTVAKEMSTIPTYTVLKKQYPNASNEQLQSIMDQKIRKIGEVHMLQAQEKHDALTNYTGQSVDKDAGNQTVFGNQGSLQATGRGMAPRTFQQTGSSLVKQPAAGTQAYDENNNPIFNRPRPLQYVAPGAVQSAPLAPPSGGPANKLPIAAPQAEGGADRPAPPTGFAEGMKGKTEDQLKGKGLSIQNVTALQAYKLIQGLRSGPTTGPWNEAVAALKANHIIPIEANDPTAIYEEANKKLSQIVQAGGQRSDAALAKSEESSPSVKTQISPALIKLTRDLIGNNRTNIVMPNEFEGNDLQNYNKHASTFATKIDQVAASYDLLPKDEKVKIWKAMKEKKDTKEGKRFFDTLRIMRKHDQFDPESLKQ